MAREDPGGRGAREAGAVRTGGKDPDAREGGVSEVAGPAAASSVRGAR